MTADPYTGRPEPRIDEMLTDPIIELVMRSDGVSVEDVALLLVRVSLRRTLDAVRPSALAA
ncbi:MAG TPA: hypothetical protein VEB64_08840 [Azospirillaceae bacterium]|nr:hypothetical protein [Azospirillaceae bacterium]